MNKYIYIVDSKLWAYWLVQRGRPISDIFNKVAELIYNLKKKGEIYVCFDIGHSDYREAEQSYYKGHRRSAMSKKTEEEQEAHKKFNEDYEKLPEVFRELGVHVAAVPGVEADDLASLLCKHHTSKGTRITLLSNDYDWFHMVVGSSNTRFYNGTSILYSRNIEDKYGLSSRRKFSVLKAIAGDKSDNLKFIYNLAEKKGKKVFDTIYDKYDDPTDEEVLSMLEDYYEEHSNLKIHPLHISDGRTTVSEAFKSNMKIVDPFTDFSKLTDTQKLGVKEVLDGNAKDTSPIDDIMQKMISALGFPIQLSDKARRVYNVK